MNDPSIEGVTEPVIEGGHAADLPDGLTARQEIVEIDVPPHKSDELHAEIMRALSQKRAHRIVTMTMTSYGEFPLFYRVLVVIEYL